MNSIIQLENIQKSYYLGKQELKVLKGISIEIFKNEYVALMGPSGSGKSTLMNLLGCLDSPTAGHYILNGKDVSKMPDDDLAEVRNKEIGFVFQQFNLLPRLTAAENVALPLIYNGTTKKIRTALALEIPRYKYVQILSRSVLAWQTEAIISLMNYPGDKISAWPLQEPWLITLLLFLQMSLPEIWIQKLLWRSCIFLIKYRPMEIQ